MSQFTVIGFETDKPIGPAKTIAGPCGQAEAFAQFSTTKPGQVFPDGIRCVQVCRLEVLDTAINTKPTENKKPFFRKKNEKTD